MVDPTATAVFVLVLVGTSLLALTARRFRRSDELPALDDWVLAGRQFGGFISWFLLGGVIFTAYTFAAVPGLTYGVGALGFFALAYTILLGPVLFVLLPRLWSVARSGGHITIADYVRARHRSPALALVVALTGILATMPYIALQLVGIRSVLTAGGIYPAGLAGDLVLTAIFAVLAGATYRSGLRAPTVISLAKGGLIFGAALASVLAVLGEFGTISTVFEAADRQLENRDAPAAALILDPSLYSAYASLALGSALALPMYPHVLTATFAAANPNSLRHAAIGLPAWTAVLGAFGLLGIAALGAGIVAPPGGAEVAVPILLQTLMPAALNGAVFGAVTVGALVPAAAMSVAVAALFVRNIYVEYFFPLATKKHELRVARYVSIMAKVGALAFVFGLREQDAINLQLLGGVWILQTFPAVVLGLMTTWWHRGALIAGWAAGMAVGTMLVISGGFTSVIDLGGLGWSGHVYIALVALAVNIVVAGAGTPLLDCCGVSRGPGPETAGRRRRRGRPAEDVE